MEDREQEKLILWLAVLVCGRGSHDFEMRHQWGLWLGRSRLSMLKIDFVRGMALKIDCGKGQEFLVLGNDAWHFATPQSKIKVRRAEEDILSGIQGN